MGVGKYVADWKTKASCLKCGKPLSASISKMNGLCCQCDVRTSKMGRRART